MPLPDETVAIPVTRGLNLKTAARLVEPPSLLEALNSRLVAGASKRYGHEAVRAVGGTYPAGLTRPSYAEPQLTPYGAKVLDASWLFGWGRMLSNRVNSDSSECDVSDYPEAGYLFGGGTRDSQVFGWSGHSLFNYTPNLPFNFRSGQIDAVMPAMRVSPVGKVTAKISHPDACDTGKLRSVIWIDAASTGALHRSVYDSQTGAPILVDDAFAAGGNITNFRCFTLGDYTHVVWYEDSGGTLSVFSYTELDIFGTSRSLGTSNGEFDVWKMDETKALVANADGTNIEFTWLDVAGEPHEDYPAPVTHAVGLPIKEVAVCTHPQGEEVGLLYVDDSAGTWRVRGVEMSRLAVAIGTTTLTTLTAAEETGQQRISIAPKYLYSTADKPLFDAYYALGEQDAVTFVYKARRLIRNTFNSAGSHSETVKWGYRVATQAFRAGNRTFVWAAAMSPLQSTWLLLNEELNPVGKLHFSVADTGYTGGSTPFPAIRSTNWHDTGPAKDRLVYHLCLASRVRVPVDSDETALFTEPTPQFVELDFLPKLQVAQAGRCTYFAGAQLWCFDGEQLTEAGFHICPETTGVAS